ncbi:uncharacterized protein LOC112227288 isoform X2 [Oncorhynchus tshawytscha]|uniref:uncharacterized protein LOC112227288 isoform X2 n=1 Tax=Oncorhynchus tshawytscha TaxID=74940 RepID=UPI000D09B8C9|nr:uncharacterized protein LOC112227288 isoform X2 [Oncorhynchus tshawytscha]
MFANSVEDLGQRKLVPRLLKTSEEELGSEGVTGYFKLFVVLLSVIIFLFWVIHLRKDDDEVYDEIDSNLVNRFTEGVTLNYKYLQRLEGRLDMKKLQIDRLNAEANFDLSSCCCYGSDSCFGGPSCSYTSDSWSERSSCRFTSDSCSGRSSCSYTSDNYSGRFSCSYTSDSWSERSSCRYTSDSCSGRSSCRNTSRTKTHSRSHCRSSESSMSSSRSSGGDCSTCQHCNKRPDRFLGGSLDSPYSLDSLDCPHPLDSPSPVESPRQPFSLSPLPGDDKGHVRYYGSTQASNTSCRSTRPSSENASQWSSPSLSSSSKYVNPSDSRLPLEYHQSPRQPTIGYYDTTKMEDKGDYVPVVATTVKSSPGCKDCSNPADSSETQKANCVDHSKTPMTVRRIITVFEIVPGKSDPPVLHSWNQRRLEVAHNERLKGGGTNTTSNLTSTSTHLETTQSTSTSSQAKTRRIARKTTSLPDFSPQRVNNPPSLSGSEGKGQDKPSIRMYLQGGAQITFITQDIQEKLESHVRRKQSQRLWGFPKLVTRYVGDHLADLAAQAPSASGDSKTVKIPGKIMGNVSDHVGRGQRNTELCFRLSNRTRPREEREETQATSPAATAKLKDNLYSSPANSRPVEKTPFTSTSTTTTPQPAETHTTRPTQTSRSLDESSLQMAPNPVTLTQERRQLEMHVKRNCLEVKLKPLPGMVATSQTTLSSATRQPTRQPIQAAALDPLKCPAPLRRRDPSAAEGYASSMDPEAPRRQEENLVMKPTSSATPSTSSAHPHSSALETWTGIDTVSGPRSASTPIRLLCYDTDTERLFVFTT